MGRVAYCHVVSCRLCVNWAIGDTTRQYATRPFFLLPIQSNGSVHTMRHDQVWSSRQKAAATKIALEAIFVVCRSDSIKKTAEEKSFYRNLNWVYKFMTQE